MPLESAGAALQMAYKKQFCLLMFNDKLFEVELKAMIAYRNNSACFKIHQERAGIFTAYLISFDGKEMESPPDEITMVRSIRNWTGSTEDDTLLRELGAFIDKHLAKNETTEL